MNGANENFVRFVQYFFTRNDWNVFVDGSTLAFPLVVVFFFFGHDCEKERESVCVRERERERNRDREKERKCWRERE